MKKLKIIIGTFLLAGGITSCSSAYYQAGSYAYDDLYATHDKTTIARKQQADAEARKAEAQARQAEWEARLAEAQAQAAQDAYEYDTNAYDEGVVADSYESAYSRRLRGFRSPSYRMPSSYYELRYTNSSQLNFALSYNPDFYNVMVSGDQVWVEPKYITSMFGSWGASPYYNNWYVGWGYSPSYAWWGYPRYSWGDWNWSVCYNPWYNPWPCSPHWGHHYPYYPGWNGGTHRPSPHPNIVRRPDYTSPSSGRQFGSGSPGGNTSYNRGNTTFGVRGSQAAGGTSSSPSYQRGASGSSFNNGTRDNRGGTTSFNRGSSSGSSTSYGGSNSNSGSSSSFNRGNSTPNSNGSSFNRGSSTSYGGSTGGSHSGGGSSGGGVSGRNAGGR